MVRMRHCLWADGRCLIRGIQLSRLAIGTQREGCWLPRVEATLPFASASTGSQHRSGTPQPIKFPLRYPRIPDRHFNRPMSKPFLDRPKINSFIG